MRTSGAMARLPYAVTVIYVPHGRAPERLTLYYRKHLHAALAECRRATLAWAQLVGGAYPVLFWMVLDCRDGTMHQLSSLPEGGASDGTQDNRLF